MAFDGQKVLALLLSSSFTLALRRVAAARYPFLDRFRVKAILTLAETDYRNCIFPREFINTLPVNSQQLGHFIRN
jgi:hypothetical protein